MDDVNELNAKTFSRLAIAFILFSLRPDKKVYELIRKIVSPLKLEVPDYDELIAERLYGMVAPPEKWFEGPEEGLRRFYFESTGSSFLDIFQVLICEPKYTEIDMQAIRALRAEFRTESLPMEILNDYLTYLNTDDAKKNMEVEQVVKEYVEYLKRREFSESFGAYLSYITPNQISLSNQIKKLIKKIYTKLQNKNTEDPLQFNALESASPDFDKDIVDAIEHMLEEASECYINQCYLATIMLCGKVTETLIKYVYKPLTKNEIYTINKKGEQIERNFKQMCDHLCADKSEFFDKRKRETLDLIYGYRSGAIHEAFWKPGQDKAYVIGRLTNDFMNDLFAYLDKHPLDSA